jgi:hypothetical protein
MCVFFIEMSTNSNESSLDYKWSDPKEIKKRWEAFAKFGGATAGTEMTGKNFDKWLKDAGVIDGVSLFIYYTMLGFDDFYCCVFLYLKFIIRTNLYAFKKNITTTITGIAFSKVSLDA